MSPLSKDILHQVLTFFVSKRQIIDGESLRAAGLVCRQWNEAVNSKTLWSIPVPLDGTPITGGGDDGDDDDDEAGSDENSSQPVSLVQTSLQIREMTTGEDGDLRILESLMGFVKLQSFGTATDLGFVVRERISGMQWLLLIARDSRKSPELIKELFEGHAELKDKFLSSPDYVAKDPSSLIPRFPSGCCMWRGRVVRWYRPATNICMATVERQLLEEAWRNRRLLSPPTLAATDTIASLLDFEKQNSRTIRLPLNSMVWANVVDWLAEQAECFDLEDKTIFQSIELLFQILTAQYRVSCV